MKLNKIARHILEIKDMSLEVEVKKHLDVLGNMVVPYRSDIIAKWLASEINEEYTKELSANIVDLVEREETSEEGVEDIPDQGLPEIADDVKKQPATPTKTAVVDTAPESEIAIDDVPESKGPGVDRDLDACNVGTNLPYDKPATFESIGYSLSLPMIGHSNYERVQQSASNLSLGSDDATTDWLTSASASSTMYTHNNMFANTLQRDDADWGQFVDHKDTKIGTMRPSLKRPGGHVSGEAAVHRVRSILGMGTTLFVPCWNSGFWVTFKAPDDAHLIEVDSAIARDKATLGRTTGGEVFSHSNVYFMKHIVNSMLDHVVKSTSPATDNAELRASISVLDYPALIVGYMNTIYPNGYNYTRPCLTNIGECNHIIKGMINLSKITWVDRSRLNDVQREHMYQAASKKVTQDQIDSYLQYFKATINNNVDVAGTLRIKLKTPSLEDSIVTGQRWVESIVDSIGNDLKLTPDERRNFALAKAKAKVVGLYSSWIDSIVELDEQGQEHVIAKDEATFESILSHVSGDEDIAEMALKGITKYIEESTITVVGIPDFECPACSESQLEDGDNYNGIIPLEAEQVFSSLIAQRLSKMLTARA